MELPPLMNAAAAPINRAALITSATHLQASKYFLVAAFTMLVFDYSITFAEEVERIWKQPWSGATFLFALNRYVSLLQRPIIVAAFLSPAWSHNISSCEHFVRFSGGSTVGIVAIGEMIMILRVWAIWHKDKRILGILCFFWVFQVAFSGMAMGFSKRIPFPPFFVGCILTGIDNHWIPFWLMPLFTDSAIFFLTILRVVMYSRTAKHSGLLKLLIRDGILYYFCIFGVNLLNVVLYIIATDDLKAIGAGFSQVLTSVMVSRLVLNLRSVRAIDTDPSAPPSSYGRGPSGKFSEAAQKASRVDQFMGALGQESLDGEPIPPFPMTVVTETYTYQSRWPEHDNLTPVATSDKSGRSARSGGTGRYF